MLQYTSIFQVVQACNARVLVEKIWVPLFAKYNKFMSLSIRYCSHQFRASETTSQSQCCTDWL